MHSENVCGTVLQAFFVYRVDFPVMLCYNEKKREARRYMYVST